MRIPALIVIGVATASVAAPAFAQIPVPTVQVPVPVPTVQVPVPTVPVPVPTVQVPVPVPTVQVPKVPVPVPTVQVPQVPDVPVPTVPPVGAPGGSSGSTGSGGGSSGGSAGGSSSGGSAGSSGGSAGSGGGSSGGGGSATGGGSGGSSGGGGTSGGGTTGGRSSAGAGGSANTRSSTRSRITDSASAACHGAAQRRECVLRETVARSSACLDGLSSAQRRVLMLRSGAGAGPPRSRGGVAKKLRISERRVIRLERTGLSRLRSLARQGACETQQTGTATAGDVTPLAASAIASTTLGGKDSPRGAGGSGGGEGGGSGGDDDRGGTEPLIGPQRGGGVAGISATNPADSST